VGSLTIASFVVGMVPVVAVSIEDRAFRNIVTIRLENAESKAWVRENFQKLSKFTLWDSGNMVMIVNKLFQSGLGEDVEKLLLKLHELNPRDPYPIDLLASFYANSNEIDKEIEFYLKFLTVDPLNYQMELLLANAYVRKGDVSLLKESVERIKALAPESQEFLDAQALLEQLETESSD
jgi:tetratricopeptide (TPR) repeat protein